MKAMFRNNKDYYFICLDFGLTYCPNGDLLQYITDAGHLEEEVVRFYAAELIEALEQLHNRHIVHRDLKVNFYLFILIKKTNVSFLA